MAGIDDRTAKAIKAIRAVIDVADANFPSDCEVQISAVGRNSATITLPAYVLREALKK